MLKVENETLYEKYEDETDWRELYDLENLRGMQGEKGLTGEGWHIDMAGWYLERPDCSSCTTTVSSCNSCSGGTVTSSSAVKLFLSMGDGLKTIVIGDVGTFRSNDGTTWVAIVASDVDDVTRYTAVDAIGTGIIDYRLQDTLNTKGKVYSCVDGVWNLLFNVATPQHQLSPTAAFYATSQTGFYMEEFVGVVGDNSQTIYMDLTTWQLGIIPDSVSPLELKVGTFTDGFEEGVGTVPIIIKPSDFAGYGLKTYTSTADGLINIQVDLKTLVGNGIQALNEVTVDGEIRDTYNIKISDVINSPNGTNTEYTGLTDSITEAYTESDGFNNLYVKSGDAIERNVRGTSVKADELSLVAANLSEIAIKTYVAGNDGVLAIHLNPAVVNINKGLLVNNSTGIEIKLSTNHTAFDFNSTGILIKNEGIQGWHLATNVVDDTKGLNMNTTSDMIEASLHASGGLVFDGVSGGIKIDTADLSWLQTGVVSKVEVWDYDGITNLGDILGDIAIVGDKNSDSYMDIKLELTGQKIAIKPETDVVQLTALINSLISTAGTGAHQHVTADVTDLQAKLDAKVDEDIKYGNIKIVPVGGSEPTPGLYIQNASGNAWGRLVAVDDFFNLGVV
ncbi:hypothetical protein KAU11_10455 [Candidatus Babeliales bacterium]|nr:hypothetical protein [Candidatus Babeliales bacterium]